MLPPAMRRMHPHRGQSPLDRLYARTSAARMFWGGWGRRDHIAAEQRGDLLGDGAAEIDLQWREARLERGLEITEGTFETPRLPLALPGVVSTAHVRLVSPQGRGATGPICLHLAATSDEFFERRHFAHALPLAERGVSSLILENPFYGRRRPPYQHDSALVYFSDLLTMARTCLEEARALVSWLDRAGYGPIVATGVSMGGQMAALTAMLAEVPIGVTPFIPPHSGTAVYSEGLLSSCVAWDVLGEPHGGPREAFVAMREALEYTDIRNFEPLTTPRAALVVGATRDGFIPATSTRIVHEAIPGARLRWLDAGHVSAFVLHRRAFLRAVFDTLALM